MNHTTSLALTDTEALIAELFTRFDHAVFAGQVRHATNIDEEVFRASGNRRVCQGLCHGTILMIEKIHADHAREVSHEEEG